MLQREFFQTDGDKEIQELLRKRDALAAELTGIKQKINELNTKAKGEPVVPDSTVCVARMDDPDQLYFYSLDRKTTLVISMSMLFSGLGKLGVKVWSGNT